MQPQELTTKTNPYRHLQKHSVNCLHTYIKLLAVQFPVNKHFTNKQTVEGSCAGQAKGLTGLGQA